MYPDHLHSYLYDMYLEILLLYSKLLFKVQTNVMLMGNNSLIQDSIFSTHIFALDSIYTFNSI